MFYKSQDIINSKNVRFSIIQYANSLPLYPEKELAESEFKRYLEAKSRKRKLEIYYSAVLWNQFQTDDNITYSNIGSPEINSGFVSKSHCAQQVGILASNDCSFGIDLEAVNPKTHKIIHKYVHEDERKKFDMESTIQLTKIWSIKEATFKFLKLEGVFFAKMLCVSNMDNNEASIVVDHPKYKGVLAVKLWKSADNSMIYSLVGKPEDISTL